MARNGDFVVAHLLEPIEAGEVLDAWPEHVTILPPFAFNDDDILLLAIHHTALEIKPQKLLTAEKRLVAEGLLARKLVPSGKVPDRPLLDVHNKLFERVVALGADFESTKYCGGAYRPHISQVPGRELVGRSEVIIVDSLSLVQKVNDKRKVVENFSLCA